MYSGTFFACDPAEMGRCTHPYPRMTSRPMASISKTLRMSCGHPNALVDLYVTSIGKFQTSGWSGPPLVLRVICEMPSSGPSRCVQSSPWTMAYLQYALSHPGICGGTVAREKVRRGAGVRVFLARRRRPGRKRAVGGDILK